MKLVDSHCHLDGKTFDADREAVLQRARDAGVDCFVTIGTGDGPPDLEAGLRVARQYDDVYTTVGIHPHDAAKAVEDNFAQLAVLCREQKVVAFGEIGLDYHYDFSPREVQWSVFIRQLEIAREARLPVVIHTREAWDDTLAILKEHTPAGGPGGIFHCFSGGAWQAEQALQLDFHLSFAGILTFPKAVNVQEACRVTPAHRLLLETDSPYLAPIPFRGKRNEPSYVLHTAKQAAALRGASVEEVAETTTNNWRRLCLQAARHER